MVSPARAAKAVGQIRNTATLVLEQAEARGITPLAAAEELVARRLAGAGGSVDRPLAQTIATR